MSVSTSSGACRISSAQASCSNLWPAVEDDEGDDDDDDDGDDDVVVVEEEKGTAA